MKDIVLELSNKLAKIVSQVYHHLHQHPELSFQEKETAALITEILRGEKIPYQEHIGGYGIMARIEAKNPDSMIIGLRADMDALPIEETNQVPFRSVKPGIMHACGHDAHTACLLGCALLLNRMRDYFEGTILLIFQPGEERHPGGARLMLQDGLFDKITPQLMIALHTNADLQTGDIALAPGCVMASADEFHLKIKGTGGHGATPQKINDTVLAASQTVVSLQQLISRRIDPFDPAVLTIGRFIADGATNIIPDTVTLSGTLRCMNQETRAFLKSKIRETIEHTVRAHDCDCDIDLKDGYPPVVNDPKVTAFATKFATDLLGEKYIKTMTSRMTSEDFGFFAEKIPSTFFRLGVKGTSNPTCGGQHTSSFLIDESALKVGVETLSYLALRFMEKSNGTSDHFPK